ncbi:Nucleolin [Dactylella cylindrospora]|nr:Nucleolin [Dactylella cylindrospora]
MVRNHFADSSNNMDHNNVDNQRSRGYNYPYPMVPQAFPAAGPVGNVGVQAQAAHQLYHAQHQHQHHSQQQGNFEMGFQSVQPPAPGPYSYIPQYPHMVAPFQMHPGMNSEVAPFYHSQFPQGYYPSFIPPYPAASGYSPIVPPQPSYVPFLHSPAQSIATSAGSLACSTRKDPSSPTTMVVSTPSKKVARKSPVIAATPGKPAPVEEESFEMPSPTASEFSGLSSATNVYIKGLPSTMTDKQLKEMVAPFGDVISSKAIVDRPSGVCKGYGFAKFTNKESAEECIKALLEKKFEVTVARDSFYSRLKDLADLESTNLYVSNLPPSWNEERIISIFTNYEATQCRLLVNPRGQSRGVSFVTFKDRNVCDEIIEKFNGISLQEPNHTLPLQVRYADTQAQKKLKKEKAAVGQFPKKSVMAQHEKQRIMMSSGPLLPRNGQWTKKETPTLLEGVNAPPTPPQSVISAEEDGTTKSEKDETASEDHN